MLTLATTAGVRSAFHVGLVLTAFGFGFRHGIDWDHIAALTDITSSQSEPRRSLWFATLYALGHALVVFVLGFAAIVLSQSLPHEVDGVMERIVGATLLALAVYVFISLARNGRDFRMRSRWMLVFLCVRRAVRWARTRADRRELIEIVHDHPYPVSRAHEHSHEHGHGARHDGIDAPLHATTGARTDMHHHWHRHVAPMPDDPFLEYAAPTVFGVGMLHGIGAETPTQVLIFVTAAGAGGRGTGLALLACFLIGLLSSNSAVALAATFGFHGATRSFRLYVGVSLMTAFFSMVVGGIFLFGGAAALPAMLGS